ncbi:hypothetical protein OQA88_11913 [Cercophora sp. LCS_1]
MDWVQASAEKAQVQQSYDHQQQLHPPSSPTSPSNSNTVPMSEEELAEPIHRSATPPPYSGPSSHPEPPATPQPKGPQLYPGLPVLDYRLYLPPLFELSPDQTTIKSSAPYLSANASALVDLIRAQSTVPPKPQIHITGKQHGSLDFAIKLNLMSLLVPDDPRKRMDYIRCVGSDEVAFRGGVKPSTEPEVDEGGLEEWARRFVEDTGSVKSFTLERVVANLDLNWLDGRIRTLVASTGYKGSVTVSFPVTHYKVVVNSPDRVNKFITGMTTLFVGKKKYEVVKAVWPFATGQMGEQGRRCAVMSEDVWFREWKDVIKYAIMTKRQGWVTNEDKLEFIMEGKAKQLPEASWNADWQ